MYTVILYLEDEQISFEKYKFVFSSFQADGQLYLCPWKSDSKSEEIVRILNEVTQSHSEWKLVVFAGKCHVMETYFSQEMSDELCRLVCLYSGRSAECGKKVLENFPEQIYYIVCRTPQQPGGKKKAIYRIDQCQDFGNNFRMFWFEINMDCKKSMSYDLFRLNCTVLALAVNNIPSGFVEYGYLYQLEIDLDKDLLKQYVLEREETLNRIRRQLEIEGEIHQEKHKKGVDYPIAANISVELDDFRKMAQKEGEAQRLKPGDLKDMKKLSDKLDLNRAKVLWGLCYPKGMLRGKAASLQQEVENKRKAGDFLNEAGKEQLERKKWETLEKICKEKRAWLKQLDFEKEFEEKEEKVRKCAEKKITRGIKVLLGFLLAVLQTAMTAPFFWYSWKEGNGGTGENLIYAILKRMSGLSPFHTWEGKESWPAWVWLFVGWLLAVYVSIGLLGFLADVCKILAYNGHIKRKLKEEQMEKEGYFKRLLKELAEYQYCMCLSREQAECETNWNEQRQRLRRHRNVCRQSNVICQQLKEFVDEEPILREIEIAPINIKEDPQDIEYYWVPFKNSKGKAEINLSGAYVDVAFYFVTGVHIMKTLTIEEK